MREKEKKNLWKKEDEDETHSKKCEEDLIMNNNRNWSIHAQKNSIFNILIGNLRNSWVLISPQNLTLHSADFCNWKLNDNNRNNPRVYKSNL